MREGSESIHSAAHYNRVRGVRGQCEEGRGRKKMSNESPVMSRNSESFTEHVFRRMQRLEHPVTSVAILFSQPQTQQYEVKR